VRRVLIAALALAAALLAPAGAQAAPVLGMGDQKPDLFTDKRFTDLGLRHARLQIGWDWSSTAWQVEELDAWLAAARRARVTPLITFGHSRVRRRSLPEPFRFVASFRRFRARYPWVRTFATWNEVNHGGEPTFRRPGYVVAYWKGMRAACPRCTVLAGELLDAPNMVRWVRRFRELAREEPRAWGLHNYLDANRFTTRGTRRLLRAVRGQVWLTEVGGLVARRDAEGNPARGRIRLDESPTHAARVTRFILDELLTLSPRITRLYLYHWNARTPRDTWDSAFISPGDRERPALRVLERFLERERERERARR